MKWPVYILLMAALTYIGETIQLPFHLLEQQQAAAASTTCHMEKGQQCPFEHAKKPSKHDSKGCCNPTADCSNCPLCYTAELSSAYTSAGSSSTVKQHYPEIPGQPLTDYTASSWKPPDA